MTGRHWPRTQIAHSGRLGDVLSAYQDMTGRLRLTVRHFDGTPWPYDPPADAVEVLDHTWPAPDPPAPPAAGPVMSPSDPGSAALPAVPAPAPPRPRPARRRPQRSVYRRVKNLPADKDPAAVALGRLGGQGNRNRPPSAARIQASRDNGAKGGRPRKLISPQEPNV
jgi:hypothetical protein